MDRATYDAVLDELHRRENNDSTEDEFEAQVIDGLEAAPDLGNFHRFTVPMTLDVTASSKDEALTLAMRWRDAVAFAGSDDPTTALETLDFDWHLHHPWGC